MPLANPTPSSTASRGAADRLGPSTPYTIPFRNDSGEEIPAFAVMLPTDISTADGEWFYTCRKPGYNDLFVRRWLVNGPYPVPVDGHGMASDGSTPCIVLRDNDTDFDDFGKGWGAQDGSWKLNGNGVGDFSYLSDSVLPTGVTDKRGLFVQATCSLLSVELTTDLEYGDYATADILIGPPDARTDSGLNLEKVWDPRLESGRMLENEETCHVAYIAGEWVVIDGPCDVAIPA